MTITADLPLDLAPTVRAACDLSAGESASREKGTVLISLATFASLLGLWFVATRFEWASPLFLPSPAEVAAQFRAVAQDGYAEGTLLTHLGSSLGRIGMALALAIVVGVPLGLAMGLNRWVRGVFSVPIDLYWGLPPLAYLPLLIIWLGIDETSKIVLLTLATLRRSAFPPRRACAPYRSSASTPPFRSAPTVCRYSPAIILPSALPEIFTGLRIADRRGAVDAGGRRADRGEIGPRLHDHVGRELPRHRYCLRRADRHRRACFQPLGRHALAGAAARALEGQALISFEFQVGRNVHVESP